MKIAIIGAGRWGQNHIRTAYELGILAAVIDSNQCVLDKIKSNYPNISTFSSLEDAGALDFDAYSVVVPAQHHYEVTKLLLNNQKHVLVEKPITLELDHARELNDLACKQNSVLMVGHLLLFHPAFLKIKELISTGKIGKLQYMYSNRLNLGTVRTEENSLWSFAPHDLSLFQFFTGEQPLSVKSNGGAFLQPHLHDTTMTIIRYPNNVVGHIFVSWLHPFKEHRFVLIGSKGMISFEDSSKDKEIWFYEKGIDWIQGEPVKRDGPTQRIAYNQSQPLQDELLHFVNCIDGKEQNSVINAQKGIEVLEILSKAQDCLKVEIFE